MLQQQAIPRSQHPKTPVFAVFIVAASAVGFFISHSGACIVEAVSITNVSGHCVRGTRGVLKVSYYQLNAPCWK